MPNFGTRQIKKIKVGEERRSKLTGTSGCGALVDFPGFAGVMGGQNLWPKNHPEKMKVHEKTLETYLRKEYFLQPALSDEYDNLCAQDMDIPICRFPEYYFCPSCHELDYANRIAKNYKQEKDKICALLCSKCGKELIPSRFILACENGHIEDFPYNWWVHKGRTDKCEKPKLRLEYVGKTGGLDSIIVSCAVCGAKASMDNCLGIDTFRGFKCNGNSPWLGKGQRCECGKNIRVLMRGASNVYYPKVESVLTIPPWSSEAQKIINQNHSVLKVFFDGGFPAELAELSVKSFFNSQGIGQFLHCSEEEFCRQVRLCFSKKPDDKVITLENILRDEYQALIGSDVDDFYFKTENTEIADELKSFFNRIKLVRRLREVQVLRGFNRINAPMEEDLSFTPISDKEEKWLPATELLGEGLFFSFSNEALAKWRDRIGNKYENMKNRYLDRKHESHVATFSADFVCLHTFAHLMIRELSFVCGYDASSLKEKIYLATTEDTPMAGVLIYTASACSDGSLGGLVMQGEPQRLKRVVFSMLERAAWCSNDPICIEASSQGLYGLNYAACYACSYISEISCQHNNLLLDRFSVVGSPENRSLGYFSELLEPT